MQEDESLRKTSVMIFQRSSEDMDVNDGKRRSDGGCKGEGLWQGILRVRGRKGYDLFALLDCLISRGDRRLSSTDLFQRFKYFRLLRRNDRRIKDLDTMQI